MNDVTKPPALKVVKGGPEIDRMHASNVAMMAAQANTILKGIENAASGYPAGSGLTDNTLAGLAHICLGIASSAKAVAARLIDINRPHATIGEIENLKSALGDVDLSGVELKKAADDNSFVLSIPDGDAVAKLMRDALGETGVKIESWKPNAKLTRIKFAVAARSTDD